MRIKFVSIKTIGQMLFASSKMSSSDEVEIVELRNPKSALNALNTNEGFYPIWKTKDLLIGRR